MKRIKLIYLTDLILFVQFVLVGGSGLIMYFNHHAAGPLLKLIHDKIGILMLVFFVAHIALNWRWIVSTTKKFSKKGKEIKKNYIMDLALFIQFVLVGGTGLIMYFYHHAGGPILKLVHDKVGILMLVFFVAHIVLNGRWMIGTTKKLCKRGKEIKENEIADKNYAPIN
jgi:hypothetical protein